MIVCNRIRQSGVAAFAAVVLAGSGTATGQELFRDQMTSGAGWGVNATADTQVTFGYDYSADGIPEAPNSQGGDTATTGVKTEANLVDPTGAEFLTLYPTGQNFTGNYRLRFDSWINFEAGGGTSTEFIGGGIGYDNVTTDVASGVQTIATGDGGSSNDWRAFKSPPQFFIAAADMAGGTRQGADAYYADFLPAVAPPAAQGQVGTSAAGSPGFQWITWEFSVVGDTVDVAIIKPDNSRLDIVTVDVTDTSDGSGGATRDGNISLFYADFFSSVAEAGRFQFGIFDNVVVDVPEPATASLLGLGALCMMRRRRA